jgi:hypothetical protein
MEAFSQNDSPSVAEAFGQNDPIRRGSSPRQDSVSISAYPQLLYIRFLSYPSSAFRTREWFNIGRDDIFHLRSTPPLVSFLVGWSQQHWICSNVRAGQTSVKVSRLGTLVLPRYKSENFMSNLKSLRVSTVCRFPSFNVCCLRYILKDWFLSFQQPCLGPLLIFSKTVPLHSTEALGERGGIAPTHSWPRH